MSERPAAFMSYVRFDDQHENGRLTELCKRLSGEVRLQIGEEFPIFQDRNDIAWGQQWKRRIDGSLDVVTFLVPIITPGFFRSGPCREELERFLERERSLGRDDLILPIYYVNLPAFDDEAKREADTLVKVIYGRQYADLRELRFEPFTSPQLGRTLARMAGEIAAAIERGTPTLPTPPAPARSAIRPSKPSPQGTLPREPKGEAAAEPEGEVTSRLAPKTEPPTRVVDAFHRGDHPSLTAALAAANPGDRILVRPGLYREGIVIEKPVEILGDGEPGEVVIEATGTNVVLFRTSMGRIANLTLRQVGGGVWYCIDIAQGRLDVEGCDITSQSLVCVAIHGGADPRLRRNRIHDGKEGGVLVYENGQGTLEDNEIFGNANAGVEIRTGGNPTLRRNRIHDGKSGGVLICENGQATLEDNEIFGNALAGVEIMTGGNPTLRRNRIHDGKGGGVYVHDSGQGTLEDNEIFGNALAGVEIKTGGNPILRRNGILNGKQSGVYVHDSGQGTLEDSEIFGNAFPGVVVKTGGNPILRRNRIYNGKQSGVHVRDSGQGTLEDNEVFGNAFAGVTIGTGGNPTLRRNRISRNEYEAVRVYEGGQGVFEENDLRGNEQGAWKVSPDSLSKITRTRNLE